ncbi:Uncharacterised protein [[Clostridium] sordellii]|uniref:DUF5592 family protein n=1 Tax=Paraclostridium sordellii TaxID=1505 RepID=UPI0005E15363|nr:DUF5592 family protein [Paeniclostridium sordellii]CEP45702.1 Uncharacterised protein [[Clostridium] sordellii] [Paeniclostridium sordellii]
MKYIIPEEISSEIKVSNKIFLFDFIVILLSILGAWLTSSLIDHRFLLFYYVFVISIAFYFVLPSKTNPEKRNYKAIAIALKNMKNVYRVKVFDK